MHRLDQRVRDPTHRRHHDRAPRAAVLSQQLGGMADTHGVSKAGAAELVDGPEGIEHEDILGIAAGTTHVKPGGYGDSAQVGTTP